MAISCIKKLSIVFNDGSKVTYTIRRSYVDHMDYFHRHSRQSMKSAILQVYPKKDNAPINLLKLKNCKDTNQSSPSSLQKQSSKL